MCTWQAQGPFSSLSQNHAAPAGLIGWLVNEHFKECKSPSFCILLLLKLLLLLFVFLSHYCFQYIALVSDFCFSLMGGGEKRVAAL